MANAPTTGSVRLVALTLAALLVMTSCTRSVGEDPEPAAAEDRIISNVWETDSSTTLDVGWFATRCEKFESLEVEELPDRINLVLSAFVDSDDCNEPGTVIVEATLAEPWGDRLVYDMNPFIRDTVLVEPPR